MKRLAVLVIGCLLGCTASPTPHYPSEMPAKAEIPFYTYEKQYYSESEYKVILVQNPKEWEELWARVEMGSWPKRLPPQIDFSEFSVLSVFMGTQPTGGYDIEVRNLWRTHDDELLVFVVETQPPEDATLLQAVTGPYHLVIFKGKVGGIKRVITQKVVR